MPLHLKHFNIKFSSFPLDSFMMILLLSISLPIILIYLLHKYRNGDVPPPGPPRLPLIGNLHQFATARNLPIYLWKQSKKYGPIMQMKIGSVHILVISSAKLAKQVMKTQDLAFCNRPKFLGPRVMSYNCLDIVFSPYGEYWREVRKITSIYVFSLKKIQSFRPIREDEIYRMVAKISDSEKRVVNLSEMAMALGSSLIGRIAFGSKYEEQGFKTRGFDALLHEAQALLTTFFVSDYFPAISWVDKLTGLTNRLDNTFKNLDFFYQELIDEHLQDNTREEEDVADVLIKLKQEKLCSIDLSWDHIKALLSDIFIAGTDTSAASIVWTLTALIKAPIVMEKLQLEIRNQIGKKGRVDEDDLPKLPYLRAVINESLRLYPPAPLLVPREAIERSILEGCLIEPKTVVYVNALAIGRDSEYWENPDEFLPDRFLNNNIDVKGQNFEVIPFGSGRRICPAIFMGLANVELTVANLLYSFDWELPPEIHAQDIDTDTLPGITMHKKNALFLVPKKYDFN